MSPLALAPNFGPLSNREVEYRRQNILTIDGNGQVRFAPLPRRDLVPPEILAEIFIHCLPDDDFVTPDLTAAPLILCGICRRWRDVALTTPTLWSSLLVEFDGMGETGAPHDAAFCQMWLSRARGSPLSICLRDTQRMPVDPLFTTVIGFSQQWQRIEFDIGPESASYIFPVGGKFPLLRSLDLSIADGYLSVSLSEAPRLREVTIYPHDPHIQLPWHQLDLLCCYEVHAPSCIEILRNSFNLLDGTFSFIDDSSVLPTSILHHNHLQRLELGTYAEVGNAPLLILSCLKIPSLKDLTLKFPYHSGTLPANVSLFLSFISQSCCQLHTLTLAYVRTTPDELIECLKAAPSLVSLRLTPYVVMDAVFAQLTGHAAFLPKLESLHIFFPFKYETSYFDASAVVQMLCWRWAAVGITRLLSFRLGYYRRELQFAEAMASHPECQALQAEGMDLYFAHTSHIAALESL
ncbi:hypothetical protein DFH06DRAFT_1159054 [Mycena polygramma]|nr:hypothetical protein DFH06DRAFT_1159054 [Mycena polygramma]